MLNVETVADFYRRKAAEERLLGSRMADRTLRAGHAAAAERYEQQARDAAALFEAA